MANYVDYDYWVYGYGDGDLTQPDRYVVAGYWVDGYAEYETVDTSSAAINATATVTANGTKVYVASGSITANAQFELNTIRIRTANAALTTIYYMAIGV